MIFSDKDLVNFFGFSYDKEQNNASQLLTGQVFTKTHLALLK